MPVIKRRESYRWTVEHVIGKRNGKPDVLAFDIEFKALPESKVYDLIAEARAGALGNDRFIEEAIIGWHDMKRDDGAVWEFSAEALKELCEQFPGMPASLSRAWTESVTGAARKN